MKYIAVFLLCAPLVLFTGGAALGSSYEGELAREVIEATLAGTSLVPEPNQEGTELRLPVANFRCEFAEQHQCTWIEGNESLGPENSRKLHSAIARVFNQNEQAPLRVIMRAWGMRLNAANPEQRHYCVAELLSPVLAL